MVQLSKLLTLLSAVMVAALIWLFIADRTVAEKVITELAMPAGLMWLGSTLALIVAGFKRQPFLFILAALIWLALFVSGNSYLAIRLARTLERPYLNNNPLEQPPMDAIVVLGGSTSVGANGVTRLGWHGDRVMLAVRLYRRGLASRVICTGGRIPALDRSGKDPKDTAAELCIEAGIPADLIERIEGINTRREMQQLGDYLQNEANQHRVGLITSAYHMPRAMRLAQAQGIELIPLPADFVTPAILFPNLLDLVPDAEAMTITRLACKEYLARFVGQ